MPHQCPTAGTEGSASLTAESDLELTRRSRSGSVAYFLLFLVHAGTTPYPHDHPRITWTIGIILLITGASRLMLAFVMARRYAECPSTWRRRFEIGTCACST